MAGIITESGVSAATGEPFVVLRWEGDQPSGQLSVAEARELALVIMGAAEAAITDAALMKWLTGPPMNIELARAAAVMSDYRVARRSIDPENLA